MFSNCLRVSALLGFLLISTVKAQYQAPNTERSGKPFTVSATVRNEYDDNTETSSTNKNESFKTMLQPSVIFNYPMDQTLFSARYGFGFTQYYDRPGEDDQDYSHDFTARVAHTFSPRFDIDAREQFTFDQRPQVGDGLSITRRLGDRIRNQASIEGTYAWSERFSTVTRYEMDFIDYSSSAQRDQDFLRHSVSQDVRYIITPTTTGVANYRYSTVDYFDDVAVGPISIPGTERDSDTHSVTFGVDHYFLPEWLVSARIGPEYQLFDNDNFYDDSISPYASVATVWNYDPRSSAKLSYAHRQSLTDNSQSAARSTDSIRLEIHHYFTPRLSLNNMVTAEVGEDDSRRSLGADNDEITMIYDGNVEFEINEWLSAVLGYRYTDVDSDIATRDYTRNQGYIAVRGTY